MKKTSILFHTTVMMLVVLLSFGFNLVVPQTILAKSLVRSAAKLSVNRPGEHGAEGPHAGGGGGGDHNANININVDHHDGGGPKEPDHHDDHHDDHHHDGGAIVAGAIAGLVVGSIVAASSMPTSCTTVVIDNVSYRHCGDTWYQPYYSGTDVKYIVVEPPI